jgi:hypothetical protein
MNDTNRLAALIKFNSNVTYEEAVAALRSIKHLLDIPVAYDSKARKEIPARCKDVIQEYNPEHGEPVFYIP